MQSIQDEPDDDEFLNSLHGIASEDLRRYRGRPLTEQDRAYLLSLSDTHPTSPQRKGSQRHPPRDTPASGEDELRRQIEAGETEARAYWARWGRNIWNDICAFANTRNGGEVWVGIKENGEVIGSDFDRIESVVAEEEHEAFRGELPQLELQSRSIRGRNVTVIRVAPAGRDALVRSDGSIYRRRGRQTVRSTPGKVIDRPEPGLELVEFHDDVVERTPDEDGDRDFDDPERESQSSTLPSGSGVAELKVSGRGVGVAGRGSDAAEVDRTDPTPAIRRGQGSRYRRFATDDEVGLNAQEYAAVVAETLRSVADDEPFCFGLFGPWGRGKTFLMDLVEKALPAPDYQFVKFSAWKYRTTPELWVHLYEQLAAGALRSSWLMPLRVGVERRGLWPAAAVVGALALALTPLADKVQWSKWLLTSLGVAGTAFLAGAIFQLRKAGLALKSTYWSMPRHQERLGLQFAVGDDLKAVLCSWLPVARPPGRALWNVVIRRPLELLGYCLALAGLWFVLRDVAVSLAAGTALSAWIVLLLAAIVLGGGLGLLAYLLRVQITSPRKVVLVVDDLDRCHPDQMLEVIECLQLFLDEDEIRKRLRIVMLVEEEILQNAIVQKYGKSRLVAASTDRNVWAERKLVRDNLEKLFLLWLRLPPLGPEQAGEIVSKAAASLVVQLETDRDASIATRPERIAESGDSIPADVPITGDKIVRIDSTLSNCEQEYLTRAVEELTRGEHANEWGPRSLRSFVFKYQLARMLLGETGHEDFDSRLLIQEMARQLRGEPAGSESGIPAALVDVARQVC